MRWLLCVLLAVISASVAIPTYLLASGYLGTLGIELDDGARIVRVDPRGPSAGRLRVGDRIDDAAQTWGERAAAPHVGQAMAVPIVRDGKHVRIDVVPGARPPRSPLGIIGLRFAIAYDLIVPFLGLFVVLRRPSVLTGALFMTCLGGSVNTAWSRVASPQFESLAALTAMLAPAALITGFIIFCTRFPNERPESRARVAEIGLLVATAVALGLYALVLYGEGAGFDTAVEYRACTLLTALVLLAAYVTFARRQRSFRGDVRVRAQWVDVGLAYYVVAFTVFFVLNVFFASDANARAISNIVYALQPAPWVMTYALTRARIVDLRFVGARAAFYALLTAVPVAVLGLVDWLAGRYLSSAKTALAVEIVATVALSFGLNALHRRAERLVDSVLFRDRRRGERRLDVAIASLAHAESRATVAKTLTADVTNAMNVASVALFAASDIGWTRDAALGWDDAATVLPAEHPLALAARTATGPIPVDDVPLDDSAPLPSGTARADTLVPLAIRHELVGFALYGRTRDGDHLDPQQLAVLSRAADAAALAYERIEIADQRRSIERLRLENETLRARLLLSSPKI